MILIALVLLYFFVYQPGTESRNESVIELPFAADISPTVSPDSAPTDGEWETDMLSTAPQTESNEIPAEEQTGKQLNEQEKELVLDENGSYDSKEDVSLYLHLYGHLPPNYITKKEAEKLGWTGGSLEKYAPGKCIGGSHFGNYEGLLPEKDGRKYTECDIDTLGAKSRGAKRIIFSNDGLIYYTADHYESFDLLYGEP